MCLWRKKRNENLLHLLLSARIELGLLTVRSVKSLDIKGKGSILDIAIPIAASKNCVQEILDLNQSHVKWIDDKVIQWEIQT